MSIGGVKVSGAGPVRIAGTAEPAPPEETPEETPGQGGLSARCLSGQLGARLRAQLAKTPRGSWRDHLVRSGNMVAATSLLPTELNRQILHGLLDNDDPVELVGRLDALAEANWPLLQEDSAVADLHRRLAVATEVSVALGAALSDAQGAPLPSALPVLAKLSKFKPDAERLQLARRIMDDGSHVDALSQPLTWLHGEQRKSVMMSALDRVGSAMRAAKTVAVFARAHGPAADAYLEAIVGGGHEYTCQVATHLGDDLRALTPKQLDPLVQAVLAGPDSAPKRNAMMALAGAFPRLSPTARQSLLQASSATPSVGFRYEVLRQVAQSAEATDQAAADFFVSVALRQQQTVEPSEEMMALMSLGPCLPEVSDRKAIVDAAFRLPAQILMGEGPQAAPFPAQYFAIVGLCGGLKHLDATDRERVFSAVMSGPPGPLRDAGIQSLATQLEALTGSQQAAVVRATAEMTDPNAKTETIENLMGGVAHLANASQRDVIVAAAFGMEASEHRTKAVRAVAGEVERRLLDGMPGSVPTAAFLTDADLLAGLGGRLAKLRDFRSGFVASVAGMNNPRSRTVGIIGLADGLAELDQEHRDALVDLAVGIRDERWRSAALAKLGGAIGLLSDRARTALLGALAGLGAGERAAVGDAIAKGLERSVPGKTAETMLAG